MEVKEVVQSIFCRRLTIGHTNNFPTVVCNGIPTKNISRYVNYFKKPLTLGLSYVHLGHHQHSQQLQELPVLHINWQSMQFHVLPPTLLYYCNC